MINKITNYIKIYQKLSKRLVMKYYWQRCMFNGACNILFSIIWSILILYGYWEKIEDRSGILRKNCEAQVHSRSNLKVQRWFKDYFGILTVILLSFSVKPNVTPKFHKSRSLPFYMKELVKVTKIKQLFTCEI